jgi:threonine/homoserine/homoserine lactone efflux protein
MLVSFIVTTWLLAILPGVGQALMLRQTMTLGSQVAVATILGTSTGLVVWTVAAGAGLSAVVLADPLLYRTLVAIGGGFLVVIGLRTLWCVRRGTSSFADDQSSMPGNRRGAYLAGLATNLGNPKAGVFALTLLPAFAGAAAGQFLPTLGLGLVWSAVTATWYLLFVWLVSRGRAWIVRPGVHAAVTYASGGVLVVVGGAVAFGI